MTEVPITINKNALENLKKIDGINELKKIGEIKKIEFSNGESPTKKYYAEKITTDKFILLKEISKNPKNRYELFSMYSIQTSDGMPKKINIDTYLIATLFNNLINHIRGKLRDKEVELNRTEIKIILK